MTTPAAKPIIIPMPGAVTTIIPGEAEAEAAAVAAAAAAAEPVVKPETPPVRDVPANLNLDAADQPKPVVVETGYAEFDTIGKLMADKGMANANTIMESFLDTGELSLTDKAAMIAALGESVATLAFTQMETTAQKIISEAKADSQKSMDYANTKFGGKDAAQTWDEIKAYVRTPEAGFTEADLATMNTMLAAGGLQAQLVIDKVHAVYTSDKTKSQPGTLLEGDLASTGLTFEPISRIDYTAAMGKAVGKYGEDSYQVRELNARREKSIARGY